MTVSSSRLGLPNATGSVALGLALALTLAGAMPAAAQDSGPLLLTPWPSDTDPTGTTNSTGSGGIVLDPVQPGATGATTSSTTPPAPTSTQPSLPPAPEGERAPEGITVNALEDISTDYSGTLEPNDGGLGYDMWAGTDRAVVEQLLPQVPIQPLSPAMRDLARRLLLSAADAPVGTANQNLMGVRAGLLAKLGNAQDIADFLELVRPDDFDPALARLQVDALLLAGQRNEACTATRGHLAQFDSDVYLQKAFAFCQMVAGERIPGMLAADLLFEQGVEDPVFYDLMAALDGASGITVDALPEPSALYLAMLDAAGMAPPADLATSGDPLILGALARNSALDPDLRLVVAEQAAARGAYPVVELVKLYRAVEVDPAERDAIMDSAVGVITPRQRALLYQQALFSTDSGVRARYLQRSLNLAREHGGYMLTAQVLLPLIADVVPAPQLTWFAADAGRALFVMKRYEQASAWFAVVRRTEAVDPVAAAALPTLWLYARIAGGADPMAWDASSLAEWRATQSAEDELNGMNALRIYAVFDGLGETIGNAADLPVATGDVAQIPNPSLFFNLAEAAASNKRGETVMLALINLGEGGPGQVNPIVLSRVLSSLRTVGLNAEARALAFEAIVAAGI